MEGAVDRSSDDPGNLPAITPVGNGWILCRSKSHGRIYYFNTVTGEAVWNLSKEEFEKAKKCTGKLPLQLENYPEPREPPGAHSNHESQRNALPHQPSHNATPKVYNKQIINNQFTRPPYSPFVAPCQNCSPLNPMPNMLGVTTQQPFNPVWIQPPPIFLNSPNLTMGNINQTSENVCHQRYQHSFTVQNTSVSLSRRFATQIRKNFDRPHGIGIFTKNMNNKYNTRKRAFVPNRMQNQNQKDIGDLRTKLSARRSSQSEIPKDTQETKSEEPTNSNKITQVSQISTSLNSMGFGDDVYANTDDEWLKFHGVVDGAKLKLDINSLKNLATGNTECKCWYIVVDKNVLMKHFNLLNVLTTSDEQCKLMIVRHVLSELQAAARADVAKDGARKVLRGLSQLFAAKVALIAEYSIKPSEIKDGSGMVNFCTMLQQQNEHVVLLTNEETIKKHLPQVPTFTIPEVKEFLTNDKTKIMKIVSPMIERNIEITIPNEIATNNVYNLAHYTEEKNNDMDTTEYVEETAACDEKITICNKEITVNNMEKAVKDVATITDLDNVKATSKVNNITKNKDNTMQERKETNVQTDSVITMVDAEVQTDARVGMMRPIIQKDSVGVNTVEENINVGSYEDRQTNVDNSVNLKNNTMSQEMKTREIRLKRSISNQTVRSNSELSDKWHRKKRVGSLADSASSLDDRISRETNAPFEYNAHSSHFTCLQDAICQPRSQSSQTRYDDFVEGSETSSCVVMRRTSCDNIIIEETSTSDIISNSMSNVDSENFNEINKSKENNVKTVENDAQNKNVMFEITSKAMEQNLKMRCDEWLAQFIQIMEEVLAQVLGRESQDIVKSMPPPWTLHEATECVKRTFSNDSDVFDAATKLSQIIYRMSDAKGKIIVNFKPNEFMELYSYGVYLVDALQNILENFEDLQIAAESLTKLLSDIENPIADSGSFGDTAEVSVVISESSNEEVSNKTPSMISKKSSTPRKNKKVADVDSKSSPGKYNLRSASKKKVNEDSNVETSTVKFVRKININEDFFTSLHLQRKDGPANSTSKITQDNAAIPRNSTAKDMPTNKSPSADKPAEKGPNIIRNFTKCPEFEERLKKQSREPLDMDMLDYSVGYDDEYNNMEGDYSDECDQVNEVNTKENNKISEKDPTDSADKSVVDDNNNDFKVVVGSMVNEIKETILNIHRFCEKTKDELQAKIMHNSRKSEVYNKAHMANMHIRDLCSSLRRIKEGSNQNSDGFQLRLKESGILLNEKQVLVYRDVINSCIEHGDTLLEALNYIMDAVRI